MTALSEHITTNMWLYDPTLTQDQKASYDFNDMDADPKPRDSDPDNWYVTHAILMARSQKLTESLSTKRTATVDCVAFVLLTPYTSDINMRILHTVL